MNPRFDCYVIQIGKSQEVLYANFSLNPARSFRRFVTKHAGLKGSRLRPDLAQDYSGYRTSSQALRATIRLIDNLESRGFEVIAGGSLLLPYYHTYVIEIEGDPHHVYVGETNYPREKRFSQHIYGFNAARELKRYDNLRLAIELCDNHHYLTKEESLSAEAQLAQSLQSRGYRVEGGH